MGVWDWDGEEVWEAVGVTVAVAVLVTVPDTVWQELKVAEFV